MEKKLTVGPISADPPSGNGPCLELALGVAAKPVGDLAEKTEPRNINETNFNTPKGLFNGDTYLWIAFRAPLK